MDARRLLRGVGLRATGPRLAVLRALEHTGPHADADDVAQAVRREGTISVQAVYDGLAALTRVGLVRRIEPAGHPARFELRAGDNHHHLICRRCGRMQDVDCVVGTSPCLEPSDFGGFAVDEAEVTFWGVCPACQAPPVSRANAAPVASASRRCWDSYPGDPEESRTEVPSPAVRGKVDAQRTDGGARSLGEGLV